MILRKVLVVFILLYLFCGIVYAQESQKQRDNSLSYYQEGLTYKGTGDYDKAIEAFSKAIEVYPQNLLAYADRAEAYEMKENFEQAYSDWGKAIEFAPDKEQKLHYYKRRLVLSLDFLGENYIDQALGDVNKMVELDPTYVPCYTTRAEIYFRKKEYDKSWLDVQKAKDLGGKIDPKFLNQLKQVSGREE